MKNSNFEKYAKNLDAKDRKMLTELYGFIRSVFKFNDAYAYNMPGYKYKGKIVCLVSNCKNHLGFYPYSGNITRLFPKELKGYVFNRGSVQLPKEKKIDKALIKKLVKARMREIEIKFGD